MLRHTQQIGFMAGGGAASYLLPAFVQGVGSADQNISFPSSNINAGDLFLFFHYEEEGSWGTPTGFTQIFSQAGTDTGNGFLGSAYKIATGSESGALGGTTTGGGRDGTVLLQFRCPSAIATFGISTVSGNSTDGSSPPTAETVAASGATGPVLGVAVTGVRDNSPLGDGEGNVTISATPDDEWFGDSGADAEDGTNNARIGVYFRIAASDSDWSISHDARVSSTEEDDHLAAFYLDQFLD